MGVVVNLAVFFAWHVLWPAGTDAALFAGGFQWFAAVVSVTAFVALVGFKRDVLDVIGASAGLGLCYTPRYRTIDGLGPMNPGLRMTG